MDPTIIITMIIGIILLVIIIMVLVYVNVSNETEKTDEKKDGKTDEKKDDAKREYEFHQGVDSGGNDISQVADFANNVNSLKTKCNTTPKCVAFNTNGWLKHTVNPPETWSKWSSDPDKGLYVLKTSN